MTRLRNTEADELEENLCLAESEYRKIGSSYEEYAWLCDEHKEDLGKYRDQLDSLKNQIDELLSYIINEFLYEIERRKKMRQARNRI
jgi:hypothetical protein